MAKVLVKCYIWELAAAFAAGLYIGKYYERKTMLEAGEVTNEQIIAADSKKKKKSVRYENGEVIFHLGR